ncbi:hypothetical protein WG904_13470 [Pedobacter sp. Du54]|uniref:hypothetical protein n=1 Tax=Pedobacter anseongensis TaxID=3133439 RepID=UPI0030A90C08
MKQIIPYQDINEALATLDNGGRFYNLFAKAENGQITAAELTKVAGMFNERQKLVLFLELSMSQLPKPDQVDIISKLEDKLRRDFLKYKAQELMASEAKQRGVLGSNAIITGVPVVKNSKSEFNGLVLVPISAGKVISFIPVPIVDQYDIYEIRDDHSSETFLVAHYHSKEKLPAKKIKVAGVLKKLEVKVDGVKGFQKFLEINYYQV